MIVTPCRDNGQVNPHDRITLSVAERATFDHVVDGERADERANRAEIVDVRHLAHAVGFHPSVGVYVSAAVMRGVRSEEPGHPDVVGGERRLASLLHRAHQAITDEANSGWIATFPWLSTRYVVHTCCVSSPSSIVVVERADEDQDAAPQLL